jgi:hypothetical protein
MLLLPNIKLHQCCPDSPRRPAGRPITAHLLRWHLVDIPYVLSTSLPPCICTILERSRIQEIDKAELSSLPAQTKLMPFGYKNVMVIF